MWIYLRFPDPDWPTVWQNIASSAPPCVMRSSLFRVVIDSVPTQVRLHQINRQPEG